MVSKEFTVSNEFMVGRVHGTIEKEQVGLATRSACVTQGGAKVRASWISQSFKSSL